MLPFPTRAPYRIDQVTAAPLGLTLLTLGLIVSAVVMTLAARNGRWRLWAAGAILLPALVTMLFGLGAWGTSDVTKLSHFFTLDRAGLTRGELFWWLIGPMIPALPYRMALVHGLVAGAYALMPILLARRWGARAWGGWWALLVVFSPLLRTFLQNGVSRQALMTLLLVPLLLGAGRLAPVRQGWIALTAFAAAGIHTTFVPTAALAVLSRLLAGPGPEARLGQPARRSLHGRRLIGIGALLTVGAGLLVLVAPMAWMKFQTYALRESFFNSYVLMLPIARLQLAMLIGAAMVCWQRRLGWRRLLACGHSRQLAGFFLLLLLLQESLRQGWVPSITNRLADTAGLFLLIVWLAWLEHHRARWAVLPSLMVTLNYWLLERLPESLTVICGRNDSFFCLPDRWPWQIRWGGEP
ncbi:hypothetical protein NZK33_06005 [Cyanobium sp. FGCU-6]|jgi:hypothetical protein|nr:hypothetical protein [Cyanobium sp. FGCU6]